MPFNYYHSLILVSPPLSLSLSSLVPYFVVCVSSLHAWISHLSPAHVTCFFCFILYVCVCTYMYIYMYHTLLYTYAYSVSLTMFMLYICHLLTRLYLGLSLFLLHLVHVHVHTQHTCTYMYFMYMYLCSFLYLFLAKSILLCTIKSFPILYYQCVQNGALELGTKSLNSFKADKHTS